MVDKLGVLEDRFGGGLPPASIDELEKRVALLLAAQEELKRRQREPIDVTPAAVGSWRIGDPTAPQRQRGPSPRA